ncbi:MAG: rhamnulokinase [Promethearchaeota archaeon]
MEEMEITMVDNKRMNVKNINKKSSILKYIGVDLGADSGRVILGLFNSVDKIIKIKEVHRFPTKGTYIFKTYRWNLIRFWEEIKRGLIKVIEENLDDLKSFKGIGVDTWGVNLIFLTEDYEFAGLPFHYRDNLTQIGDETWRKMLDPKEVFGITGIQEVVYNGLVHLAGMYKLYPEILKRTKYVMMIPDYFNFLLTGTTTTEYTNATTSQLFDSHKKEWSDKLLKPFGLNNKMFPPLKFPGEKIGVLNKDLLKELELNMGKSGLFDELNKLNIPVWAIATHDTGSAVIGVPATEKDKDGKDQHDEEEDSGDWAFLSSGTWSLLGMEVKSPIINDEAKKFNLTNEGGAFGTIRLLKNIMGLWLLQRCKVIWDAEAELKGQPPLSYSDISELAIKEVGGRVIIDVDSPEFFNPDNMILAIQEHIKRKRNRNSDTQSDIWVPKTIGEITRVIYDSLAYKYGEILKMLEKVTKKKVKRLYIVGGGSQDKLLNQITADTLGIDVYAGPIEATAIGNILMQAYADKQIKSLKEIRQIIRRSFKIQKFAPQKKHI